MSGHAFLEPRLRGQAQSGAQNERDQGRLFHDFVSCSELLACLRRRSASSAVEPFSSALRSPVAQNQGA
jgi:hypothetical protein